MNVVMVTNNYAPHVGGVAQSVERFTLEFRRRGHRVLVIAPKFEKDGASEPDVVRVPAIRHFNGSDFAFSLPVPLFLTRRLRKFRPDVVHSHYPFLLGGKALRMARVRGIPAVFTYHTMYERYTHYFPGSSPRTQRFVVELARRFANLNDGVIAPSHGVARMLESRGVVRPVSVIPTGVDIDAFSSGDGALARRRFGVPKDAFLVGHAGRLAPEKNVPLLAEAMAAFLAARPGAHFMLIGYGPETEPVQVLFEERGLACRAHLTGTLIGKDLIDAYHAMDAFAFASQTETQGMVLTEAMAAGVPVVAVSAQGSFEVVIDGVTGRLVGNSCDEMARSLEWIHDLDPDARTRMREAAVAASLEYSMVKCADRALAFYERLIEEKAGEKNRLSNAAKNEWRLWRGRMASAAVAVRPRSRARR